MWPVDGLIVVAVFLRSPLLSGSRTLNVKSAFSELLAIARQIGSGLIPQFRQSEAFTAGAFDMVFTNLHDEDAFRLLCYACKQYDSIKSDTQTLVGFIYIVSDLARQSATTELPPGMGQIIVNNPDQTSELRKWYSFDTGG